jgi:hypothetical protein
MLSELSGAVPCTSITFTVKGWANNWPQLNTTISNKKYFMLGYWLTHITKNWAICYVCQPMVVNFMNLLTNGRHCVTPS